jgi:hypothetical protein
MKITHEGWTLFEYDVKLGRQVWYSVNDDGSTTWRTDYAVQPTVDMNQAQRNLSQKGWAGDYHQVASIPLNVYYDQLAAASQQGDDKYLSKWLNDGSNAAWRTKDGRI